MLAFIGISVSRASMGIPPKGGHRHFKHPDERHVITVPGNEGKELAPGTLNARLKKAGLK